TLFDRAKYFISFLGGPFASGSVLDPLSTALVCGLTMLALVLGAGAYFLWAWSSRCDFEACRRMLIWIAFSGMALLSAGMGAIFRAHLSAEQAMSSRYAAFAVSLPVALVNLIPMICQDWLNWRSPSVPEGPDALGPTLTAQPLRRIDRAAVYLPAIMTTVLLLVQCQGLPQSIHGM